MLCVRDGVYNRPKYEALRDLLSKARRDPNVDIDADIDINKLDKSIPTAKMIAKNYGTF